MYTVKGAKALGQKTLGKGQKRNARKRTKLIDDTTLRIYMLLAIHNIMILGNVERKYGK